MKGHEKLAALEIHFLDLEFALSRPTCRPILQFVRLVNFQIGPTIADTQAGAAAS